MMVRRAAYILGSRTAGCAAACQVRFYRNRADQRHEDE
jgi:hypothetical protein